MSCMWPEINKDDVLFCSKNNYFIQVKSLFSVVEFSNTVNFDENAPFDAIFTSVTIIKQVFHRKLFCYESLVDIEVSKH